MADVPKVVTDIAPVHSLAAKVMAGVGEPTLLVPATQSPHDFSMKPSGASALQSADLVLWIGHDLTPWLEKPLEALAGETTTIELLDVPGITQFQFREEVIFAEDDHDDHDAHGDHDDHAEHKDHDDHDDHAEHKDHDDHDDHAGHDGHDHHDHDGVDPHAWLDPDNATVWMAAIAEALAAQDPENAATYRQNAEAASAELTSLTAELTAKLDASGTQSSITMHDAYQYFEAKFGLMVVGSISPGDASDPSPARLVELRDAVRDQNVACAYSEPQYNTRVLEAVAEGTDMKIAVLDPLGAKLEEGPDLYAAVLTQMADAIAACN